MELPSQYDPKTVEKRLYDFWLKERLFHADAASPKPKYVIILPPPNVTGVLHIGHALTCTLEDILIRRKRMQGHNALWLPGTDHAGIATQMVVERNLMKEEKISRHDLGREKFLERVWEWKEKSQGTIVGQLKLMGCSLDWDRIAFTLDENVSLAVRECFVRLYREKLVYREEAIIQWCPRCRTALSDLEVKFKELPGKLWHIRYLSAKDPKKWLIVATTRPETLLGDTAVAVHPEDERFRDFHGGEVLVPLVNRPVPVIQDAYVDRAFGTGALKITPAHDPNDAVVGKRHGLKALNIMDERAHLNAAAGPYQGLSREKAREKVLEDLKAQGLLEKEVDHAHNVGHCDRCGTTVEPRLSAQWFVNAEVLAKPAIEAVEKKEIRIIPEEWEKTYFEWMRNIRPWCVSRQLWWGHRIPVWYCQKCGQHEAFVEAPEKCGACGARELKQDEDVLDTWFSSGLWPFSTLGWPKDTPDLRAFYPNDVMETGFDILFFWVARMIMLGMKMVGKIPFHTVYLHPMVRDEYGQKMSKTKGNVKDPLEIIERMGADSLRFTLAAMAVHGRDVLLSDSRIEGYRNFVNKIWNASRFVLMHFGEVRKENVEPNEINQWIWSALNHTKRDVNRALEEFRFFDAANLLYHFIWDTYCFWFIELIKSEEELAARKARQDSTAVQVLEETLRLLHPLMPFLTEEIWQRLPLRSGEKSISIAAYPQWSDRQEFPVAEARMERVTALIGDIRSQRGVHNVPPSTEIGVTLFAAEGLNVQTELVPYLALVRKLARVRVDFTTHELPSATYLGVFQKDLAIYFLRTDLGDVEKEKTRKLKEYEEKNQALQRAIEKLANPGFQKAPPPVRAGVEKQRDELAAEVEALRRYLVESGALKA